MALLTTPSRDVIRPTLLVAMMWMCKSIAASDACPRGCECTRNQTHVFCSEIGSFPIGLPATTRSIVLTRSYLSEIPSGAFDNMPDLRQVTLMNLTVGSIRQRAFHRIGSTQTEASFMTLTIHSSSITNIESEAFVDLEGFKTIVITRTNISTVATGAFSRFRNIESFSMNYVYIPVIRSSTFADFTNVEEFFFRESAADVIETDAFSHFTNVKRVVFEKTIVGVVGNRFMTIDNADNVVIVTSTFRLWKKCAFCGISASNVDIIGNVVAISEGNVFSGMSGVRRLQVKNNILPSIVARFFPYDLATLDFIGNNVMTIMCETRGSDYPSTIEYEITGNEIACDCRLNWLWLKWSETRAARVIASGFLCEGPEQVKQSMHDFFMETSSIRGIDSPCDGLVAVNYCIDTPAVTVTMATTPTSTAATAFATASPKLNASSVVNKTSWVSITVMMCLTLMAS